MSQIHELRRRTETAKKHLFQRLRTQFFRDFAVFVARFGNERSQTLGLKKKKNKVKTQLWPIEITTIFELSWFKI